MRQWQRQHPIPGDRPHSADLIANQNIQPQKGGPVSAGLPFASSGCRPGQKSALDAYEVDAHDQIQELVRLSLGGADRDKLDPILDAFIRGGLEADQSRCSRCKEGRFPGSLWRACAARYAGHLRREANSVRRRASGRLPVLTAVAAASAGVSEGNGDVEQVEQLLPGARRCGGGGGSSYVESTATNVHMWQGWKNRARNGLVVLSW
jgi:hypothetical protein